MLDVELLVSDRFTTTLSALSLRPSSAASRAIFDVIVVLLEDAKIAHNYFSSDWMLPIVAWHARDAAVRGRVLHSLLEAGADPIVAGDAFSLLFDALQSFRDADAAFWNDFVETIGKLVDRCEALVSVVVARLPALVHVLNRLCQGPGAEDCFIGVVRLYKRATNDVVLGAEDAAALTGALGRLLSANADFLAFEDLAELLTGGTKFIRQRALAWPILAGWLETPRVRAPLGLLLVLCTASRTNCVSCHEGPLDLQLLRWLAAAKNRTCTHM
jgi:hypothetical protein